MKTEFLPRIIASPSRFLAFTVAWGAVCVSWASPEATAQDLKISSVASLNWSGPNAVRYPLKLDAPFKADLESLNQYQVPDWFRDAKFGIFLHWGIFSVPAYGTADYGGFMYQPHDVVDHNLRDLVYGTIFDYHQKYYGNQDAFGYKDFIPMFTAKKWDPNQWASFFKECGAKYVVEVATYHDGFAMYDTSFSKWNAAKMGPKRNVAVELAKAVRQQGLKFGVSSHYAWHWRWYTFKPGFDTMDPANVELYGVPHDNLEWPPKDPNFDADEFWRSIELVELIKPDMLWFDAGIERASYADYRAKIAAHYYNRARDWGKEVVLCYKGDAFPEKAAVLDLEQTAMPAIRKQPWQTDTSPQQNWGYKKDDPFRGPDNVYRGPQWCIDQLVDVVSKNGCLLLNIGPRSDGTIPDVVQDTFREVGNWLKVNGEAIYATRPYQVFGEGPDLKGKYHTDAAVSVRYTQSKDHKTLYAIAMDWPKTNALLSLKLVNITKAAPNASVTLVGNTNKLNYLIQDGHISITLPKLQPFQRPTVYAYPFKLSGFEFGSVEKYGVKIHADSEASTENAAEQVLDGDTNTFWHTPWEGAAPNFPHELVLELSKPVKLAGISCLPRQDGSQNGWIKDYAVFVSDDGKHWGEPVAGGLFQRDAELKTVMFAKPVEARFLKLQAKSSFRQKQPYASLAELNLIFGE